MPQRVHILCDLTEIRELSSTGIFMLRLPCSALRILQAALQSTRGNRCVRTLASFYLAPVVNAVIHAADGRANLQVFCREKSGNGCPMSVCL